MIEIEHEEDGRWIAAVPTLPGVMAYGGTEDEARRNVVALAFHVIGDRIKHNEPVLIPGINVQAFSLFDDLPDEVETALVTMSYGSAARA